MTEVTFHFNAADKLQYSCRLLRKACAQGKQVVVTGDAVLLAELDALLWTFSATDFIAHCQADARPDCVDFSAVLLCPGSADLAAFAQRQVLVNLGPEVPAAFTQFARCIEIVALDDADRQAGRQRWKHYAEQGYPAQRYDVTASQGNA